MAKIKIIWDPKARNAFKKYLNRVKRDSLQAAENVREDVLATIGELANHPKMFPPAGASLQLVAIALNDV